MKLEERLKLAVFYGYIIKSWAYFHWSFLALNKQSNGFLKLFKTAHLATVVIFYIGICTQKSLYLPIESEQKMSNYIIQYQKEPKLDFGHKINRIVLLGIVASSKYFLAKVTRTIG